MSPIEGWTWREKYGWPVYTSKENLKNGKPLTKEDLVLPGMDVLVICLNGYTFATLCKNEFGVYFAETEHTYWPMDYDEEDNCFVTLMCGNKAAIKIIEKSLEKSDG